VKAAGWSGRFSSATVAVHAAEGAVLSGARSPFCVARSAVTDPFCQGAGSRSDELDLSADARTSRPLTAVGKDPRCSRLCCRPGDTGRGLRSIAGAEFLSSKTAT